MMMLAYWLAHGEPRRLIQLPGNTDVTIEKAARTLSGKGVRLTRLLDRETSVVRESVWLNDRQEIARPRRTPAISDRSRGRSISRRAGRSLFERRFPDRNSMSCGALFKDRSARFASGNLRQHADKTLIDGNGEFCTAPPPAPPPNCDVATMGGSKAAGAIQIPSGIPVIDGRAPPRGGGPPTRADPGLWECTRISRRSNTARVISRTASPPRARLGDEFEFIHRMFGTKSIKVEALGPHLILAALVDRSDRTYGVKEPTQRSRAARCVAKYEAAGFAR